MVQDGSFEVAEYARDNLVAGRLEQDVSLGAERQHEPPEVFGVEVVAVARRQTARRLAAHDAHGVWDWDAVDIQPYCPFGWTNA